MGKEVGDLMLHMVFYSRLGSEAGVFDAADVLHGICDKLVTRHPHIYGDVEAATEEEVKANWEKIKLKEKGEERQSVLQGVPSGLPSLVKAQRIQEKVRGVGFDWDHAGQVWDKVQEELGELRTELDAQECDADRVTDEFGDVMFALINYARFVDVNPDEALERTTRRFMARFQHLENAVREEGKDLSDMTLAEMDVYWDRAKQALKS